MHSFRNILYASTGIGDDIEGLKQALGLARANRAALKCLLVYPELPKSHEMYQDRYREFLLEQMDTAIRQARAACTCAATTRRSRSNWTPGPTRRRCA